MELDPAAAAEANVDGAICDFRDVARRESFRVKLGDSIDWFWVGEWEGRGRGGRTSVDRAID